jgi:hypothetical protein
MSKAYVVIESGHCDAVHEVLGVFDSQEEVI